MRKSPNANRSPARNTRSRRSRVGGSVDDQMLSADIARKAARRLVGTLERARQRGPAIDRLQADRLVAIRAPRALRESAPALCPRPTPITGSDDARPQDYHENHRDHRQLRHQRAALDRRLPGGRLGSPPFGTRSAQDRKPPASRRRGLRFRRSSQLRARPCGHRCAGADFTGAARPDGLGAGADRVRAARRGRRRHQALGARR